MSLYEVSCKSLSFIPLTDGRMISFYVHITTAVSSGDFAISQYLRAPDTSRNSHFNCTYR